MKKTVLRILLTVLLIVPALSACQHENDDKPIAYDTNVVLIKETKVPNFGTPDDHTPLENLSFAAYNLNHAATWESSYKGEVTAVGVKQQVRNKRIYDNGALFCEAISISSLKKVGEQKYFCGDKILVRSYKKIDKNTITATWSNSVNAIARDDYFTKYGLMPKEIFKYSINDSTIISSERTDGENYTFKFVLSPECADYLKAEVKTMANARSYPEFLEMECTVEMDEHWNIIRTTSKERYTLSILGNITCTSEATEDFTLNGSVAIPDKELFDSKVAE